MLISEVIQNVKDYCKGSVKDLDAGLNGAEKPIDDAKSRDQVLYGNPHQECTGIVTTCWASYEVIEKAIELGANLIIPHEALFWNHGDHQEWLAENENPTYLAKKKLLDEHGIVVWRNHDYIHSGIPVGDGYVDGIFYGVAHALGWTEYIVGDQANPLYYEIPETSAEDLAHFVIEKFHLNGIKVIGNLDTKITKVCIPFHILGEAKEYINEAGKNDIDCFMTMELIDYTLAEYVRDASMAKQGKVILAMGHFNLEEPGMAYMPTYMDEALGEHIPCTFVQSGDNYEYVVK